MKPDTRRWLAMLSLYLHAMGLSTDLTDSEMKDHGLCASQGTSVNVYVPGRHEKAGTLNVAPSFSPCPKSGTDIQLTAHRQFLFLNWKSPLRNALLSQACPGKSNPRERA